MIKKYTTYDSALKSAVYFQEPEAGFLRVKDRDRINFLQRQTTNDLRLVSADRIISTALTSPTARIIDLFWVIDEGESLGLITLPGRATKTHQFLQSRIFFSDQVRVNDHSPDFSQIHLLGPNQNDILREIGLNPPPVGSLIKHQIAGQTIRILNQSLLANRGYLFVVPSAILNAVFGVLDQAGAGQIDTKTFEILRIEAGQPGPANELVDAYTPLEVGLRTVISESKGCYTGQEVLTRQIAYDKINKVIVGVKMDKPLTAGAEIKVAGKSAGTLTSTTVSPRFGPIGLGLIRRSYQEAGTKVLIVAEEGQNTSAEITSLPFQ
jgi:folate-binding protein YgfZ